MVDFKNYVYKSQTKQKTEKKNMTNRSQLQNGRPQW